MLDTLIRLVTSVQVVRRLIGGNWYCIALYNQNQMVWLCSVPEGYHVIDSEVWD